MTYHRSDEILEADPPHAFAAWEGAPCSCPSRYYGGDCAHTAPELDELERWHLSAELTGGRIPEHVPGAYPSLSCCGGPVELVAAGELLVERDRPIVAESELELRAAWGDR